MRQNLLLLEYDDCEPANFWNSANLVSYVPRLYAVIWGCRDLPNSKHEQGAWVLGYKSSFGEATKKLDQAMIVDLNFARAPMRDFILHNQTYAGNATACSLKVCEYNHLCKSGDDDSTEVD